MLQYMLEWRCALVLCIGVRLRAAVFVNAVAIREAVSLKHGIILPDVCLSKLQSANYLFHSALNSALPGRCDMHMLYDFYVRA